MRTLREVLEGLIKYQKVPCNCACKDGIENVSIDKAIKEIRGLVAEEKIVVIMKNDSQIKMQQQLWNSCREETLRNFGE